MRNELRKAGARVSEMCALPPVAPDLEPMKKRLLACRVAKTGLVFTEAHVAALEKKREDDLAYGEIETTHPGDAGSQHTFYMGTLKGVGRICQQTFVDTMSRGLLPGMNSRCRA